MSNHAPPKILHYDTEFNLIEVCENEVDPEKIFLKGSFVVMLSLLEPFQSGRIVWMDSDFKVIRWGGTHEPLAKIIPMGQSGDLSLVGDTLWMANTYDPWIQIYDWSGKHLLTCGKHLKEAFYCMHSEQLQYIKKHDYRELHRKTLNMQITKNIINLEDKLVMVGPYIYKTIGSGRDPGSSANIRHWDVYAPDGTLLIPQMPCPIRDSGNRFVQNGNNDEFYLIDDISDDLESKNLSARIHIYRLAPRWREALEQMKAKAAS